MSSAYSSNTIDDAISVMVNVMTTATQKCQTQVFESQSLEFKDLKGVTIDIGTINFSEVVSMDIDCTQTDDVQNSIDASVQQTIDQIAKAIGQALSIPGNSATSKNVQKLLVDMGINIKNAFNTTCKNTLDTSQGFTIEDSSDSKFTIASITWDENIDANVQCIQKVQAVNDVKVSLQQQIEQKAESKIESILGPLFMIILIIVVIIAVLLIGGGKALTNPKFLIILFIIIGVYLGLAAWRKWWPF